MTVFYGTGVRPESDGFFFGLIKYLACSQLRLVPSLGFHFTHLVDRINKLPLT